MKKMSKKSQLGWTTMEYVVGAIIIIGIVTTVVGMVSTGLNNKAQKLETTLSN
jgi:Flp pilus assembly pilin Flp